VAKGRSALEAKLFINFINFAFWVEHFHGGGSATNVALVECSEYHFLDSSIFIFDDAADFIAVRNLSASIAKQCKVHQIEC